MVESCWWRNVRKRGVQNNILYSRKIKIRSLVGSAFEHIFTRVELESSHAGGGGVAGHALPGEQGADVFLEKLCALFGVCGDNAKVNGKCDSN